jgi:WD40 repeat protein
MAYYIDGKPGRIIVVENPSGKVRYRFDLPASEETGQMLFRQDSGLLASVTSAGDTLAWDLSDGRECVRRKGDGPVDNPWFAPTFTPEGRLLTVVSLKDRLVFLDLLTGEELQMRPELVIDRLTEAGISKLLVSGDGRQLLGLPGENDLVRVATPIWDLTTGERQGELRPLDDEISGLIRAVSSPDGRRLFKVCIPASFDASVGSSEPVLSMWNLDSRERLWQVRRNVLVSAWAFSADGQLLAIGYRSGFVELWDVEYGEELFRWQPRGQREIRSIAFSPDNVLIATGDGSGPIQLLHLAELRQQLMEMGLDF